MFENPIIGVGTFNPSPRAKELVMQALENRRLSYGPMMQEFEHSFSKLHGCRFGVMSNSGTSALHVAVAALKEIHGWNDGDEVLVPATTFIATSNVILHNNLTPVFVDVDPLYYCLDPNLIAEKITSRTRAIIPVHVFGQSADMDPIRVLASEANLKIIEDTCETMFATYKGESVGSMGDIGCYSTYIAHLIVTGVGGMNTTNNPEYAVKIRSLVNHGRDSLYLNIDDDNELTKEELRVVVGRRFSFVSLGHSFRITELEAALGLAQLEEWECLIEKRRAHARHLVRELSVYGDRMQLPAIRPGCEHSFMMFPIVLKDQPKRDLVHYLEEHGVETRDMLPLINQPIYQSLLKLRSDDFPVSKWITESGFYIGCHQDLSDSDLDYMIELFVRFWKPRVQASQKETSLLVLVFPEQGADLDEILESLPFELFDVVVGLVRTCSEGWQQTFARYRIHLKAIGAEDPLCFLARQGVSHENIVVFPADGSYGTRDIAKLLFALESGNDMVLASRFLPGGVRHDLAKRFPYRSLGNRIFTMLANILFYGNLTDSLSGFRGLKIAAFQSIPTPGKDLSLLYTLSIQAMKCRWKVREVPTQESVELSHLHKRKAWGSLIPMFSILIKEWFKKEKKPI
ncbi:DegT/DnrJ/EryC1/StrS family aminotransferase [Candidatus Nitrospira salsa]